MLRRCSVEESQWLSFPSPSVGVAQAWSHCWTSLFDTGVGMGQEKRHPCMVAVKMRNTIQSAASATMCGRTGMQVLVCSLCCYPWPALSCSYMCILTCATQKHMHTCTHTHTYTCTHAHMHTHTCTHTHAHTHTHMYTHMYAFTHRVFIHSSTSSREKTTPLQEGTKQKTGIDYLAGEMLDLMFHLVKTTNLI